MCALHCRGTAAPAVPGGFAVHDGSSASGCEAEAVECDGPSGHLSFTRMLERESVATLISMVSSSSLQGKTNAATALGHLALDSALHTEVPYLANLALVASMC